MKVLHIIPSLDGSSGGPVQAIRQLCQELKNQGVEAVIATTRIDNYKNLDTIQVMSDSGFAYYFNRQCNSFLPTQFAFSPTLNRWLDRHIREFDLLHIHYLFTYPSTIACYHARKQRIPYIIRPAGMLRYPCLKKSAFKKKLYTLFFEKRNLKNAAAIHFTSEKEKDTIEGIKLNNQYSVAVPHGLDMDKFKNLGHFKGLFKKYYPQVSGKKIILFLSRVDPIKGMDLLIPALRILLNKRHDFIFVVAGPSSGDYQSWVREALGDAGLIKSTIFTGFLDGWMKFAAFADSDIFVLPSYHENFGLAVVEAMAAALPVVVSNKVDIYKLIEDYRAGIVAGMNSQEIALGLDRLLSDEYLRQQMGANGVKLAEENFDIKKIARQMQEIYAQLITKNYYSGAVS